MEESYEILLRDMWDKFLKTQLVSYGTPDQYQFHHNQLCKSVAAYILSENKEFIEKIQQEKENKGQKDSN